MLPPTSERLREASTVPYFLWDDRMTVEEARRVLAEGDRAARDELIARILREANTRDVWLFVTWTMVDEAWERVEHKLGRARPMWTLLRARHLEHAGNAA